MDVVGESEEEGVTEGLAEVVGVGETEGLGDVEAEADGE